MISIGTSELILNSDGSIYHLHLKPGELANDIIVVGDPGRVPVISAYFDSIEIKRQNREIFTHTGYIGKKRISVLSTGMGTDNIDIVLNEIDALFNIDLQKRLPKEEHTSLNIIRLGTSGSLQADIEADSMVASTHGIGLDGMLYYYRDAPSVIDAELTKAFVDQTSWNHEFPRPYVVAASEELLNMIAPGFALGMTATAPGFYGPQGRTLRLPARHSDLNLALTNFNASGKRIINFEMETSALYGLGKLLGHQTLTICAIIANRITQTYSKDYQITIKKLIETLLERMERL
ncbi:MAG: nucleoside phosphorylase [Lentimicrobiaceae bacterium]|jgi:uridine phosphorylase|nr:nucleoside phosphorylase [Lentimicrobiaceae bacterium]MDD4597119.1 nucleoside phosphorylase [Lentimicrobiaceae bacterium]MDY0025120.1 nucleoside phosphorylase [Lentimicrobium sp.]HAH59953.1 phosphorylase [Bacteroidales bacterium]